MVNISEAACFGVHEELYLCKLVNGWKRVPEPFILQASCTMATASGFRLLCFGVVTVKLISCVTQAIVAPASLGRFNASEKMSGRGHR
jgi:hypothetical protein